ncbi:unnamed protein product (macronuclear) [Paramecium tetraurelia]|uniref:Uncharacterized protein n=1 Tax=Paramecium tetraurelia TaxID=5888 RepID=A0E0J5_PARTE|nr:uncharacterized protein GSPATT00021980001 [Paramecium tetraurelia]CAK88812.1 unnamed protein product [Paramecium tetraurelia]|eukprot:XP_001456209.1 hypothetical protein (macronuclear) [Paramecium tetraurelia strain d4-2]
MLAPQYILTKFQEFLETQLENKPNKNEVIKKLRDFNRYFAANNYNIGKGFEYFQNNQNSMQQLAPIPKIIIDKLQIPETTMQLTGQGLQGLYYAIMIGLQNKKGQFIAEGTAYQQLNQLIKTNQIHQSIGLWYFTEIASILLKNSINLNLSNHLLENGIKISDQIDIKNLSIGQSALLVDNLKYVINVDIQQILYYKPNKTLHRLVLLNSSLPNCVKIMIENDIYQDVLLFSLFQEDQNNQRNQQQKYPQQQQQQYQSQQQQIQYSGQSSNKSISIQQQVKMLLEEMNQQTDLLIEQNQLKTLPEFKAQQYVKQMKNQILSEEKKKKCLKCQQEFSSDIGSIAGQITNFCMKCYKEFSI